MGISWAAAAGAEFYSVYKETSNGISGWIGDTKELTFFDRNIGPDLTISEPIQFNPFLGANNFPGAVGYYEQRQVFGGTNNLPDTMWFSKTNNRTNVSSSTPALATDGIEVTLSSQEVNVIRHFLPSKDLITFTSGSEWRINSGNEGGFSGATIRLKPQSDWGVAQHRPIRIGNEIVFVDESNARVRSMGYSFVDDAFTGQDMNILSNHIFVDKSSDEYVITDWAFTKFPEPRMYLVRSDGMAATMTYDKEQKVLAWTRWSTQGEYERVVTLRRNVNLVEDGVFFVIKREVDGNIVRYIERLHSRKFADARSAFFLDAGSAADSRITISGTETDENGVITITTDGPHGIASGEEFSLTDIVLIDDADGDPIPEPCAGRNFVAANVGGETLEVGVPGTWTTTSGSENIDDYDMSTVNFTAHYEINKSLYRNNSMFMSVDGTKVWGTDGSADVVHYIVLSTAYDITSSTLTATLDISGNGGTPSCLWWNADGSQLFVGYGGIGAQIETWDMSGAYDITTGILNNTIDLSPEFSSLDGMSFTPDGTKMIVVSQVGDRIAQYTLAAAFDLSDINKDVELDINVLSGAAYITPSQFLWHISDGTKGYVSIQGGTAGNRFLEMNFSTAYNLSTFTTFGESGHGTAPSPSSFWIAGDGAGGAGAGKIYSVRTTQSRIYQGDFTLVTNTVESGSEVFTPALCTPNAQFICSCVTTVSGLDHLEGEDVVVLIDGAAGAGTVSGGALSISQRCACLVNIGLRYCVDIETLNVEVPSATTGTIQGKPKKITDVLIRFFKSRLPLVGPDVDNLLPMKQRSDEKWGDSAYLLSGDRVINIKPQWNSNGRIYIRQCEPVPLTILGIVPDINTASKTATAVVQQSNTGSRRA